MILSVSAKPASIVETLIVAKLVAEPETEVQKNDRYQNTNYNSHRISPFSTVSTFFLGPDFARGITVKST
jgi:hypothetical protein